MKRHGFNFLALLGTVLCLPTLIATSAISQSHHCYQSHTILYQDFLKDNFDGTPNYLNPIAQIYASSKSGNEVYNLQEMMQEADQDKFLITMHDKVFLQEGLLEENTQKQNGQALQATTRQRSVY